MASMWDLPAPSEEPSSKKSPEQPISMWDLPSPDAAPASPQKRGLLGAANDYAIDIANAALNLPKAALDLAVPGSDLSASISRLQAEGEFKQSDVAKAAKAKLSQSMQSDDLIEQAKGAAQYAIQNPGLAASQALGSFVGPGFAIKGGKLAAGALNLGEKAAGRAATVSGMATTGVLAGGDAAGDAYQTVMNSPSLANLPIEERERMATDAARKAAPVPFLIGAASGAFGAEKALATGTKSILKTGLSEFASEAIEEGSTKLSANIAAKQYAPETQVMSGVVGSAVLGGMLGGGTGLAVGALSKQPDSLLLGSTNISAGNQSPDGNAIEKAIDSNSTEVVTPDPLKQQELDNIKAQQEELQQAQVAAQQEAAAVAAQQVQVKAEEDKAAFNQAAVTYGVKPLDVANQFEVAGKRFFSLPQATAFLQEIDKLNEGKSPEQKALIGAALESGAVKVQQTANAKSINNSAIKFLDSWGFGDAMDKAEAATRAETLIKSLEGPKALKEAEQINNFYKAVTGVNSPEFDKLQALAAEQPKLTKAAQPKQGASNEQLQLQTNAGLREIPVQSGTTQASGTGTGNVRPSQVQSIGAGSFGAGSPSVQAGAIPSGGVPTSTGTDVSGPNLANAPEEAQVSSKREDALKVVNQVITRAFGERDAKIVLEVLTKEKTQAQIGKEFGISDARVNQLVGPQAQETWGARILLAARNMGIPKAEMQSLLETISEEETTAEEQVVNEELLTEAPTEETSAMNVDDTNIATSDEDMRLGKEEVSTGEEGGPSGFRVFNPDVSGATELEDASANNRTRRKLKTTELKNLKDFELNNLAADENTTVEELDSIVEELLRRQEIRVNKGADNANEKPSTKKKTVGNKPASSERVREQDTEGSKAAREGQAKTETKKQEVVAPAPVKEMALYVINSDLAKGYTPLEPSDWAWGKNKPDNLTHDEWFIREVSQSTALANAFLKNVPVKQIQEAQEAVTWNLLPVPIRYEQLSPQAKADWAISVKEGKTNLAAASQVYDANEDNIIDGTDLITEVGEEQQVKMLTYQVNKLDEEQSRRLEEHYEADRDSDEFFQKLREDVLSYVNKGANSVAAAVRDIIKSIANGVMAMAVVFNPTMVSQPFQFAVPTYETKTVEIVAPVPAEAAQVMSPAAKRAYEVIYPTIKDQLVKNDKLFIVTDKPTATNFIFSPDGKVLFQSKVLLSKTEGNYYKGDNNIVANRITPAGLYNLGMREGGKTAGEYDFNKVFGVEQVENGSKYFVTMMHSVWTKESDAGQRLAALKEAGPQNSRYSFGCINVDKETFGKILAGHEKQMDGAKLFIVPDGKENVMEFINGKAVYSTDMIREKAEPIFKTEKVPTKGTSSTERTLAAKEEKATEETTKLSSKSKKFFFDEIENTERGFDSIRGDLAELGIENALDFVSDWSFVDIKGGEPGAIESIGGRYVITVNNNAEFTDAYIAETARHEIGHAVDMAPHGGVYSAQKEMGVALKDGVITPIGSVAREMHNLYKNDPVWNEFLGYPFDSKTFTDLDTHVKIESELFAQLFTVYTNPRGRAKLEAEAPIAAAYMKEVINDIQSTKAFQIQKAGTAAERVVRFQARNATKRPQAPSSPIPRRQEEVGAVIRSRSVKDARVFADKQLDKLPKEVQGPVRYVTDTIENFAKKSIPWAAFTEDLADIASKYIPSVKKYVALMKERQAIRTKFERQVDNILQDYDKLPSEVKGTGEKSVNKFLMDSTREGKWAYNPGWIKDFDEKKDIDVDMQARFDAMPATAQAMIKRVFAHGQSTLLAMQKSVIENITSDYDALIAAAKTAGNVQEEQDLIKKKAASLTDYRTLMRINAKKPYAPLKRYGDYVVVGKSQQFLDNERISNDPNATPDEQAEARKKLRELEKNDMHYFVQFAETVGEAKALARQEANNYAQVEDFEKDTSNSYGGRDIQGAFHRLRGMVEETKDSNLGDASERAVNRLLADLHLTLLSEQSARQSERRRRGIGGAEKDMMRAFATQGRAAASFISSLENTGDIYEVLREMKKETDSSASPGTRADRRQYYNEFMKRHFMGMDYRPSPFMDKALSATSMWMLLTNPAYYLQNMTQPFMMSLPVIGGKHGYARSWKEMTRAYNDIASVIKKFGLGEESYNKLPEDVRNVVEELVNRGRIDISLEQDLGRWRSTEDSKLAKFGRATELLRGMAQDIETINRVATAVAAYRLEVKGSNPTRAINYADKIIYTTHGDYSGFNAPRITREGLGRLATQFRKFQLIQISLMARLYNDAFHGEDADTRLIGKKALAYTIGHTAVMGGIMGLPGFAAVAALYGMMFGDEDEPDNPELALRRAIGDDTLADLLVKGVPASLGVDVSGKLGMGQMLSILPYTDVKFTRKELPQAGYALLTGPFGGLTLKGADAVSYIGSGDYQKGLEQLLPSGLGNILKAQRFASEGITTRAGDVVMKPEDIGTIDAFMVALGLPTKPITDRNFLNAAKFQYDEFYNEKASDIKREYVRAYKEGDNAKLQESREDWKSLQESRAKNGYSKQPLSNLLKAPQEQKKRERNVTGGVQYNKSNRGFVKQTSEL